VLAAASESHASISKIVKLPQFQLADALVVPPPLPPLSFAGDTSSLQMPKACFARFTTVLCAERWASFLTEPLLLKAVSSFPRPETLS